MQNGLFINIIQENVDTSVAIPLIFAQIECRGRKSFWNIKNGEAAGYEKSYEIFHNYSDSEKMIYGDELYLIINPQLQIIEGQMEAFDTNKTNPWLVINIQDGCYISIVSIDDTIYPKIQQIYSSAQLLIAENLIGQELN
jgi:hypothetical protein